MEADNKADGKNVPFFGVFFIPELYRCSTWCLEVKRYQLGAAEPHRQRVVVGGVEPLTSGVDPGQLKSIVLQKLLPLDLIDVLLRLGFGERRHVPKTGPLGADLYSRTERAKTPEEVGTLVMCLILYM